VPSRILRCIPTRARLARLSRAYQLVPALAHLRIFHALMHFAPDRTQTAYHDSHIRLFLAPSCTMRHIPVHTRSAHLSHVHQHVPALMQLTHTHRTHAANFTRGSHQMRSEWGHSEFKSLGDVRNNASHCVIWHFSLGNTWHELAAPLWVLSAAIPI
jgi:hypothetical protein